MKTKILIMRPDQPHETQDVVLRDEEGFDKNKQLHELLDPLVEGTFEHVYVLADFSGGTNYQPADMFVNEMSARNGMPPNGAATDIYRRNAIMNQGAQAIDLPFIYGPAVLFQKRVWK